MKRFLWSMVLVVLCAGALPLTAQTPIPAKPVDPHQAIPAQPVEPAAPAPGPASDTNVPGTTAPQVTLAIIADSSLRQVLQELAQSWADSKETNPQVPLTLTNAGTIRAKVEAASIWDVVISADIQDVKEMTRKGVLMADGQRSLARNTLAIYGRKALVKDDELEWFDLVGTEWKKVAMGNPEFVSSARVAQRALQKHSLADADHKSIYVYAPTEASALNIVERDQADAVFVYQTDLGTVNLPGFEALPISSDDAPPIFYTAAVSRLAKNPEMAHAFIDYCTSDPAKEIWKKYGFETN